MVRVEGITNDVTTSRNYETLRRTFREYYFRHGKNIEYPKAINQREFGLRYFGSNGEPAKMIRHLTFKNEGEILATAIREIPSDFYCSNAYYRFPSYPMQEKEWLGADLIFDIDAKDMHLPCQASHSYSICDGCLHAFRNTKGVDRCELCGSQNLVLESIPCKRCFEGTKSEVQKLHDMLIDEFGIHEESIHIYFSGNEGFHLYVTDSSFLSLDAQARSDMSGYILGKGLMPETIGVYRRIRRIDGNKRSSTTINNREGIFDGTVYGPSFHSTSPNSFDKENDQRDFLIKLSRSNLKYGWRKRLLQKLGVKNFSETRLSNIVQQNGGYSGFKTELDKIGKELGINIDPQVTMDIHRIFRMPGTLNSKSGLAKMKCSDLKSFDPLNEACLVGGELIKIRANATVKFTLKEQEFHVEKKITFLPAYAAIYLVCKRLATVV